jgi:hypothetical protein
MNTMTIAMASTTTTLEIAETPAIDVAPAKAVTSETKGKSATDRFETFVSRKATFYANSIFKKSF